MKPQSLLRSLASPLALALMVASGLPVLIVTVLSARLVWVLSTQH